MNASRTTKRPTTSNVLQALGILAFGQFVGVNCAQAQATQDRPVQPVQLCREVAASVRSGALTWKRIDSAFGCAGDRSPVVSAMWARRELDPVVLNSLQAHTARYATANILEQMKSIALRDVSAAIRYAALGVIISNAAPTYRLRSSDTTMTIRGSLPQVDHPWTAPSRELSQLSMQMLHELAMNATPTDVRTAATVALREIRK